jgi:hypothetical protein
MKSKRLRRLQIGTIGVMLLYMLMLGYFLHTVITSNPMWSQPMAERRIESDKTVQELQSDLRDAAQNFSHALHVKNELLLIYFGSTVAMIGFLGWSTFMIFRSKREVGHAA